ncbi:hypothetical protein D3C76_859610 [compost metagenome]
MAPTISPSFVNKSDIVTLSIILTPFFSAVLRTLTVISRSTPIIPVIGPVGNTLNVPSSL